MDKTKIVDADLPSGIFPFDIFSIKIADNLVLSVEVYIPLILILILLAVLYWFVVRRRNTFEIVELEIQLGNIGKATLKPNYTDIQIAHKIWTELVTRKAAIKIDPDNDVIVEIYDSWHVLFQRIRELISEIPAQQIRKSKSTQTLVDIATRSLNDGLRPHLTQWQARFRNWYGYQDQMLKDSTPQEVQRKFEKYDELISDLEKVNGELISYARELKKISEGK